MPLATKNGSLVVKDGKVAENCDCCGGWYCCADMACVLNGITSATISISATDYLRWSNYQISSSSTGYESDAFLGAAIAGTHALSADGGTTKAWSKVFANYLSLPNGGNAPVATVRLGTAYDPPTSTTRMTFSISYYYFARELYSQEYRDPRQWQDVPGGYMGTQPMYKSVVVPCPTYSGTSELAFTSVLQPNYAWPSTLTQPTIVLEQGSSAVTVSVEWS
jgi:hypothetical protein